MESKAPITQKANRALAVIIIAFILILLRVWYLTVLAHEQYLTLSKRPQRKTFIEEPDRGTIRDRFNEPFAVNKVLYTAAILYDEIKEIPRMRWEREKGKKKKVYPRKQYVEDLSKMLAEFFSMNAQDIEDLIYAKASIFPNTPLSIKENLTEHEYAKIKLLAKDWPGLKISTRSSRFYPYGPIGCNIIGYLGKINSSQYLMIRSEIEMLTQAMRDRDAHLPIPLPRGYISWSQARERLKELKEKSYTIHAKVGKAGIEKQFDEDLRGKIGLKKYEINTEGKLIRRLPDSSSSVSGRRILLTLSKELQEYAEQLLAENERIREERFRLSGKGHSNFLPPWIKGGSIVVMDPNTSEILCAASYPRFNPNDFVTYENSLDKQKEIQIHKWLESDLYLSLLWEGKLPLEREYYDEKKGYYVESKYLTWDTFLDSVLSLNCQVRKNLRKVSSLYAASDVLNAFDTLKEILALTPIEVIDYLYPESQGNTVIHSTKTPYHFEEQQKWIAELKVPLDEYFLSIKENKDKLLFLDLLKIACPHNALSDEVLLSIGKWPLHRFWTCNQLFLQIKRDLKSYLKESFHNEIFPLWRAEHFRKYLKEKRLIEKKNKRYEKPFTDYLEEEENRQFDAYFASHFHKNLLKVLTDHTDQILINFSCDAYPKLKQYLSLLSLSDIHQLVLATRSLEDLDAPLWGYYPKLCRNHPVEQDLAKRFYPSSGFGFLRSNAFQHPHSTGSIYKIVPAYAAILQSKRQHNRLNPLTIFDEIKREHLANRGQILGYTEDRKPITRQYKGGRMPKSHRSSGKIDLIKAMEHSSNIYFSLLASEVIANPKDLYDISKQFSLGTKTGIDLPSEHPGNLPDDLLDNKTGLYSFAIGQHTLTSTPLQNAVLMSCLANGGKVYKPQIVKAILNVEPHLQKSTFDMEEYPYKEYLFNIGIFFPFFNEAVPKQQVPFIFSQQTQTKQTLDLDIEVRDYLFKALYGVVNSKEGNARSSVIRMLYEFPERKKRYQQNAPYLLGKTGTAEIAFKPTMDAETNPILATHIWFSGISFKDKQLKEPELVVIVFLRYGDYGKECAPLASEMISKWHEILKKHSNNH